MERHAARPALVRVFSGQEVEFEEEAAVLHLPGCQLCWDLAVRVVEELRREGQLAPSFAPAHEILDLFGRKQAGALSWLLVRGRRAELARLPFREQRGRIEAEPELQTLEMFSALAEEAASISREDPHLGKDAASVAHALVDAIPKDRCPEPLRNDLWAEVLTIVGNCHRLAGNWRESAAALTAARGHLLRGTGKPTREARLLSIQASLASDTGRLEQSLELLGRSSDLYHWAQDIEAVAAVRVQEAGTLMAAGRHEEAIIRAEEALRELTPKNARLEMLARNIITVSLAFLGRPDEALQSFCATQTLHRQLGGRSNELIAGYLEALLLDARGHHREAEKAFRINIAGYMEGELYKTAFLHLVTFLQSLVRRGAFDKAAQVCEEALEMIEQAGSACHSQMIELWRGLLDLINARRLTDYQVLAARQYLVRHWNAPAGYAPLELRVPVSERITGGRRTEPDASPRVETRGYERPSVAGPAPLPPRGYREAKERYDRELIMAALKRCGGSVRAASDLLGITRNTLRGKIKRYGLEAGEPGAAPGRQETTQDNEVEALDRMLRARAQWGELKSLPPGQRARRLHDIPSLQTREMFDAMLDEVPILASSDPLRGEETALLAHTLAGLLRLERRHAEAERNDLQGMALLAVADCRRLAGDGQGASAALDAVRRHLEQGSGGPAREARFLAVQASLLADTGQVDTALALLTRAAAIYSRALDHSAAASVILQVATTLLAAGRHQEAVNRAEAALRRLPPGEPRLELLAKNVITESLILLGRTDEALHTLYSTLPLYKELRSQRTELHLGYLEALLLDALGYDREAEAAFRNSLQGYIDAGLYKDASLTALTRLELLLGRGELERAAEACEEALARIEEAGVAGHVENRKLWQALLTRVRERALTESHMLEARHYLVRWGAVAVHRSAQQDVALCLPAWVTGPETLETAAEPEPPVGAVSLSTVEGLLLAEPPDPAERLAELGYKGALERYSREVVAAGLAQSRGSFEEAGRLLGLSAKEVRAKLRGGVGE